MNATEKRVVWKYQGDLYCYGGQRFDMPADAQVVHVAEQNGLMTLWAEMDLSAPFVSRQFVLVGTGHPIAAGLVYVGTIMRDPFVWHVYEQEVCHE